MASQFTHNFIVNIENGAWTMEAYFLASCVYILEGQVQGMQE